ncbi:hypothetical protein IE996_29185 [Klebsiella pneumoniae]|uniref:Uncharacterized protein n=1 Tax=Klebsiella pneumoniae TaxID=573 RepID=A0A927HQF4_KLEPN|nr:hypothetical protein [Klebsiella pneumoniae]MBD3709949.1 hypothetical protein [Klebsiella pneumoniae]
MGKIQLSISDVFRSEPCRPQWDYPVFIAVPDQLGHVIPSGFFSEIRPAAYKKSWLHATGERSLQTQLVEYKKQTAKFTFLAMACRLCSHLFTLFWVNKKKTSMMQITTFTN